MRAGLDGLRTRIRNHVAWAREACDAIRALDGFEIVMEPILGLFTCRRPGDDAAQQALVDALNDDGRIYLTQAAFAGRKVIRFQVGRFDATREDVLTGPAVIRDVWRRVADAAQPPADTPADRA